MSFNRKIIKDEMAYDSHELRKFLDTSGWSFDPTRFGFRIGRNFDSQQVPMLSEMPTKFYWIADKVIKYKMLSAQSTLPFTVVTDKFTIKKNQRTGEYLINRKRSGKENEKTLLSVINNQVEAYWILKASGALRDRA